MAGFGDRRHQKEPDVLHTKIIGAHGWAIRCYLKRKAVFQDSGIRAWVSEREIARALGFSRNTVAKYAEILWKRGYIEREFEVGRGFKLRLTTWVLKGPPQESSPTPDRGRSKG